MPTGFAERLERARYEATVRVARLLRVTYATRRSRALVSGEDGREVFAKRNLVGTSLLRIGGNVLQRIEGTGAEFLDDAAWFAREVAVSGALGRDAVKLRTDGVLLVPRLEGVDLATILRRADRSDEQKLAAFSTCVIGLAALHEAGLTHADATSENVIVDGDRGRWIDFETKHREDTEPAAARADDLRTLLFSSVWAADGLAREIVSRAFEVAPDLALWRALAALRRGTSGSLVRVAQAPMPWALYAETWQEVARVIASSRAA